MKMKRTLTTLVAICLLVIAQTSAIAQNGPAPSPLQKISQMVGLTEVNIEYSRPSLAGRALYKELAPAGERWRTGANLRTVISFSKDVMLGGNEVKAGAYNLFTIPGTEEWTIILNNNTEETSAGKVNDDNNILSFKVKPTTKKDAVETFTINITDFDKVAMDNAHIELAWANTSVKFPIKVTN